jgi:hypothetical protein
MLSLLFFGLFGACLHATPAAAQVNLIVGMTGACDVFVVADAVTKCPPKGILYSHLANGRAFLAIALPNGETLSFVGEKDS